MLRRTIATASLLVVLGGGMFLTTPAGASAPGTFDCRETVRAYCQWVADNYCSTGATCKYNTSTCEVIYAQCHES